jgi:hypothetical protein
MDQTIHHKNPDGSEKPAPQSKSQLRMEPQEDIVLRQIQTTASPYVGIAAASANPKDTCVFVLPPGRRNPETLDYAIMAASQWWPGETDYQIMAADQLFEQSHVDALGFPAGSSIMRDGTVIGKFSAG